MREIEVRKVLGLHKIPFEDFQKWMNHQTVGIYNDGGLDYYEYDVTRYVRMRVFGEPTIWD